MLLFRIKMSKCDSSCLVSRLNLSQCQAKRLKPIYSDHLLTSVTPDGDDSEDEDWKALQMPRGMIFLNNSSFLRIVYTMLESTVGGFSWQICTKRKQYYAKRLQNDLSVFLLTDIMLLKINFSSCNNNRLIRSMTIIFSPLILIY